MTEPNLDIIKNRIKHVGDHWIWTAGKTGGSRLKPRPIVRYEGKTRGATLVVWYIVTGKWPRKLILHKRECNRTDCVNPDHLYEGTHQDNMNDKVASITHCKRGHLLSGKNLYMDFTKRQCKTCVAARSKAWRLKKKANG